MAYAPDVYTALNARVFGAKGDGVTNDTAALQAWLDAGLGPASAPHGTNYYLNNPLYLPPGHYIITSPLSIKAAQGAHIFGAGRFTSTIENTSGTSGCFAINGLGFSRIELLQLKASGAAVVIMELDWDGVVPVSTQSNTFADLIFQGAGYGIRMGISDFQVSETLILDCFFANHAAAGIYVANYNALQQTIVGGNFQSCNIGIRVNKGAAEVISGVGFQGSTLYDIQIDNQSHDAYLISGCRTESLNFLNNANGATVVLSGCSQTNVNPGIFATNINGPLTLIGCDSAAGTVHADTQSNLVRIGCKFVTDWLVGGPIPTSLDVQAAQRYTQTVNNAAGTTIPGRAIMCGILLRTGAPGAGFSDTTDTAANILATSPINQPVKDVPLLVIDWLVWNQTGKTMTINGGTGVTMLGTNTIAANSMRRFEGIVTNADTPTISFYGP